MYIENRACTRIHNDIDIDIGTMYVPLYIYMHNIYIYIHTCTYTSTYAYSRMYIYSILHDLGGDACREIVPNCPPLVYQKQYCARLYSCMPQCD